MSFLRRLFSRGPKLPEPVYDPFEGYEEARAVMDGLRTGDWRSAAALLARTRQGDDRAFVAGHIAEATQGWPAWIDEWHAAESSRAEPWLIRGAARIGSAWAARGSGRASEVAEDAWPVFEERLAQAEADLAEAARRDEQDATPWAYLLITGRGLGAEVDELAKRFEEARTRDPRGWLAPTQAVESLAEKWCGSHDVMFAFAFTLGEDQARARAAFDRLGNELTQSPWSHLGDPAEMFSRARAFAYSS
jgi:hypothetical protein